MALNRYNCIVCGAKEEIPDFVLTVFPEADVICPKCKKSMNRKIKMSDAIDNSNAGIKIGNKEQSSHPVDPRPDLKEDAYLWIELLNRLYAMHKDLYFAFHGLRCAGSKLALKNNKIEFTFSDELSSESIEKTRENYIKPNVKIIQGVMARLAKDLTSNKSLKDCPV